ncbi:UMP-CMP kinase [Geosmithia morbida]|uniref:Uridylate kinase n=1 Tax=Geosmithia morbida TaxID=1094350 RepID=A0A9P5D5A0_9HYPO|nr:UMP-CMP kinase [Geosmithia morbida]KAF4123575.1 UMP-CMP kinase [Geosmithia morbida]
MASRMPLRRLAGRVSRPGAPSFSAGAAPRFALQRRAYSAEAPKSTSSGIKFWPFFAIIGLGSLGYIGLVNRRKDAPPEQQQQQQQQELSPPTKSTPTFSPEKVTVLFVLGGPGAGKGTQCAKLVKDYGFTHLSAGDLLRAEQERPGSQFGDLIRDYIKNGLIVPMEVTVQLLENAMADALRESGSADGKGRFLVDGFPRKLDQAHKFEEAVCPAKMVLFYDCPEDVMESRLLERGKTSGRSDDNAESIRKRFRTFVETSMPVVDYYSKQDKVIKVDATATPDNVYSATQKALTDRLGPSI